MNTCIDCDHFKLYLGNKPVDGRCFHKEHPDEGHNANDPACKDFEPEKPTSSFEPEKLKQIQDLNGIDSDT